MERQAKQLFYRVVYSEKSTEGGLYMETTLSNECNGDKLMSDVIT